VPPALNPLIYSMRNKDLETALWKLVTGYVLDTVYFQSASASDS